ncbi:MAG: Holliday junction branch migration protein RuvA [Desulfovibrionaceae bacterium]
MIAYLTGRVVEFTDHSLVLLTPGGVGFEVRCTAKTAAALGFGAKVDEHAGDPAPEARLFVHTHITERAVDLFGFLSADERDLFRLLLTIDKLGPKKALAILAHFDAEHLRELAVRQDADALAAVPGIGPKSSRQIMWHLKDRVADMGAAVRSGRTKGPAAGPGGEYLDALAGLKNLGYTEDEARDLLRDIFEDEPDLDAAGAIRLALKKAARNRT